MGIGFVRKGALLQSLQLSLLTGANLLASIGGGKVLSACEGVTGLVVLKWSGAADRHAALLVELGAGLSEILVLALLGHIRSRGGGAVALAFGIVATAVAVALFLMMLGELRFSGWVVISAIGFALTAWAVREVNPLNSYADSRKKTLKQ